MYAVGAELPFPGWFFEGRKNEYNDSIKKISISKKKKYIHHDLRISFFFNQLAKCLFFEHYSTMSI